MAKKQFKAESKRLLDLMINSIYTHKEIFLRELISNASDAVDKLYYKTITEGDTGISRDDFGIRIEADRENRTLRIIDNGMGMTREELEKNLGTIAKSGSMDFKSEMDKKDEIDIIGQFGVGFYSAFMVSDKVSVLSRAYGSDEAYMWESSGADGYTITEAEKDSNGTEITLTLKEDTDDTVDRLTPDGISASSVKSCTAYFSSALLIHEIPFSFSAGPIFRMPFVTASTGIFILAVFSSSPAVNSHSSSFTRSSEIVIRRSLHFSSVTAISLSNMRSAVTYWLSSDPSLYDPTVTSSSCGEYSSSVLTLPHDASITADMTAVTAAMNILRIIAHMFSDLSLSIFT